jgi:Alpha-L-fucosidase
MSEAELKSMLKSSIHFKSLGGLRCAELKADAEALEAWRDMKFGLFIHWGLYSMLGRGEWAMFNEGIPAEEYAKLADRFVPSSFDGRAWAEAARGAGAKYMVLTARHHDGFSLWDSPGSYRSFTSAQAGSRRDFVREYTEACRAAGLKVGLYYSLMDWRFPGYFKPRELVDDALAMKAQAHAQVEELTSRYGKIDIIWYDGAWLAHQGHDPDAAWLWDPVALNKIVLKNNPRTIINPRSGWEGHFCCDEGSHEITGEIIPVPWEKNLCLCSGTSWGWIPDDPVTPLPDVIRMLVNVFVRDGNVLLNVAPDAEGLIPPESLRRLAEVGRWMSNHGRAIYGKRAGPYQPVDRVYGSLYSGSTAYLHVLDPEAFSRLALPDIGRRLLRCATLSGAPLRWEGPGGGIRIELPQSLREGIDTVLELEFDGPIEMRREAIDLAQ